MTTAMAKLMRIIQRLGIAAPHSRVVTQNNPSPALRTKWMSSAHQPMQKSATILITIAMDSSTTSRAAPHHNVQPTPIVATAIIPFVPMASAGSATTTQNAGQTSVTEVAACHASWARTLVATWSSIVFVGRHSKVTRPSAAAAKTQLSVRRVKCSRQSAI